MIALADAEEIWKGLSSMGGQKAPAQVLLMALRAAEKKGKWAGLRLAQDHLMEKASDAASRRDELGRRPRPDADRMEKEYENRRLYEDAADEVGEMIQAVAGEP
jgi:hypothetical protein